MGAVVSLSAYRVQPKIYYNVIFELLLSSKQATTRLAQLVERKTFNLVVEGSSPSSGAYVKFIFVHPSRTFI